MKFPRLPKCSAPWRTLPWVRGTLIGLIPLLSVVLVQLVAAQTWAEAANWVDHHTAAVFFTYLLLLGVEGLLLLLTRRLFPAAAVVVLIPMLYAVANHLKEAVNGAPILASDLTMAGHAGEIASFLRPGMELGSGTMTALWLGATVLAAAFLFSKGRAIHLSWPRRLGCAALVLSLLLNVAWSPAASALLSGEEGESQGTRNERLGLLAGMYAALQHSAMEKPDTYSDNNLNRILLELEAQQEAQTAPTGERPHVVLLVSESFFDLTRLPGVTFEEDPIPNFHALLAENGGGRFLSGAYAGGTGNVEMELFTGIPSAFPSATESLTSLSGSGVYKRIPSLVKAFGGQGYETVMVHSYNDSLYNRSANLPDLGFDELIYDRDFTVDKTYAGGYLSDDTWADQIIARFEERGEDPLFLYGLSMENHQPYFAGKFDSPSGVDYTCDALTGDDLGAFDALVHGIHDADAALGKLVDYFSRCEEPVLLVFLGDHLPGLYLSGTDTVYSALGVVDSPSTEDWDAKTLLEMHKTDYLVWNNYGAEPDCPDLVSVTGMGSQLLTWAGLWKPLWFTWVDTAMADLKLYRERLFVDGAGNAYDAPPEESAETVSIYRTLVYDLLYGEGYLAEKLTDYQPPDTP